MKLILAIVNNDDSARASSALIDAGFWVTRLATTGGFLMVGNTTMLIGTDEEGVKKAIEILKAHCPTRKQVSTSTASFGMGANHMSIPEEVKVGGATVFVLDVAQMERI
ncbi:MAG: cyclic-di-AMP receptor [Oscillospiraceae bacterium]|nr:cyclic-di-AMP receptor [Oscillospiraceae bacterium]